MPRDPRHPHADAPSPLSQAFLAAARPSVRRQLAGAGELEQVLGRLCEAAGSAWPQLGLEPALFAAYVGERLPESPKPLDALGSLHATDLFLAFECTRKNSRALAELERRIIPDVARTAREMGETPAFVDEVRQLLCQALLAGTADRPLQIANYSGRGALSSWLKSTTLHAAANLRRREPRHEHPDLDDEAAGVVADVELQYIKARYRGDFKASFRQALADLSERERNVLRLHAVQGVRMDRIAAFYRVDDSTVSRWLAKAREALLASTRAHLGERLGLDSREVDSMLLLLRSDLDASLVKFAESL